MNYTELKNGENAGRTRDVINNNFKEIVSYLNKDFKNAGLLSSFTKGSWINSDEYHCFTYSIDFDFSVNGNYVNFCVYNGNNELVYCDIVRDIDKNKLIICSDIAFEGWVSCR